MSDAAPNSRSVHRSACSSGVHCRYMQWHGLSRPSGSARLFTKDAMMAGWRPSTMSGRRPGGEEGEDGVDGEEGEEEEEDAMPSANSLHEL